MTPLAPTQDQAVSFYRAALSTARWIDQESDPRVLDADADAAWRAYGGDLPAVIRCDLVLRNFAMLYPAAFAPGPVFGLSGWYDDDPWGTGFTRPEPNLVEGLFALRKVPASAVEALDLAVSAWGLRAAEPPADADAAALSRLAARLSPSTGLLVAGARAAATVARAFLRGERLKPRTQIVLVSERPESRHALGVLCALLRDQGVPQLVDPRRQADEPAERWAQREKQRLGAAQVRLLALSPDATAAEQEAARALAAAFGAEETIDIAGS